jgi:hypothetical protein
MRFPSIESRTGTILPGEFWAGHELCFCIHDAMTQMLVSGQNAGAFHVRFELSEEERESFESSKNIFRWLGEYRKPEDHAAVLVTTMFPAILSDMLHCIYEALESSRKAKLNVSYMLLRKPIQESLYVLEAVIADRADFAKKLTEDPIKLEGRGASGRETHAANIAKVLAAIGNDGRFSAHYVAQLRYDKSSEDGFDGICNKAMHLVTSSKAIATEKMNINFIFSGWHAKQTQWSFLYTRLPYLLAYTYQIVETVCSAIAPGPLEYRDDIDRRIAAHVLIWSGALDATYASGPLLVFAFKYREWLFAHCKAHGFGTPEFKDLVRMCQTGAFPGESRWSNWRRLRRFRIAAEKCGSTPVSWLSKVQGAFGLDPIL